MGANMSLVFFTSFVQAAVGMVILFCLLPRGAGVPAESVQGNIIVNRLKSRGGIALAVALVLTGFGVLFSLLHLSDPLISFYSITNLTASWLSREILFVGFFGFAALVFFFIRSPVANIVSAAAGIGLIFVMSRVYVNTPVLFWSTSQTFWVFISTSLLLGSATLILVASVRSRGQSALTQNLASGLLPVVLVIAAGARLIFGFMQLLQGIEAPLRLDLVFINLIGILLSLVLLFLAVQRGSRMQEGGGAHFAALAFVVAALLWVGEIAGRIMFYEALSSFTM